MQENAMLDKEAKQLFGLPDELFVPRRPASNVITKRDVRAIALAHLGLHQHTILWDIGSGTGSVTIEAAHLIRYGHVYAIECDTEAIEAIKANCQRLHAPNVSVIAGRAPQVLHDLPDPHAVFIGGSGGALTAILEVVIRRLHPGGHLVVNLAALEHLSEAVIYLQQASWALECTMVNIAQTRNILDMTRFAAMNPVFILTAYAPVDKQEE
jgi:precorrin-6B C5,15-methyltransferase / cobalt-precorrin-6B C5,C15-methyltransferase